ncbi:MAG: hypothetical protein AAGC79_15005 [Pseudomonadota bacterium]
MVLRFVKSVGFSAVVLFLTLPYLALSFAVFWGASWIMAPWQGEMATAVIALVTLVPLVLTAFRIDRSAARLASLVEEEKTSFLFLPTQYWFTGFLMAGGPIIALVLLGIMTLDHRGLFDLTTPLGEIAQTEVALNTYDLITTLGMLLFFLAYGVNSVRRSVHERDPPSLFSAWASVLLFTVPFVVIAKVVTLALLDLMTFLPFDGFIVKRDLTLGHALAIQIAVLCCLYATNSALVLRVRLEKILAQIESQRMLPE